MLAFNLRDEFLWPSVVQQNILYLYRYSDGAFCQSKQDQFILALSEARPVQDEGAKRGILPLKPEEIMPHSLQPGLGSFVNNKCPEISEPVLFLPTCPA